jgi:hypothetical protein
LTGRIFLKLISGVLLLMLLALATVDYFAPDVADRKSTRLNSSHP